MENKKEETFHLRTLEDKDGVTFIAVPDLFNYLELLSLKNPSITARDVKFLLKNLTPTKK